MSKSEEQPETSSGVGDTIGLLLLMSASSLVGFYIMYSLYSRELLDTLPILPKAKLTDLSTRFKGLDGLFTIYIPIIVFILVGFVLVNRLPLILGNAEKREKLYNRLWHGLIPIGSVLFFVLLVFRFLGSKFVNIESTWMNMLTFVLIVMGVIGTGLVSILLVGNNR
jgi:hypothetical protein